MKAKLIKREDGLYSLYDENGKLIYGKLSIKNCQAIENGYDLDDSLSNFQSLQQTEWDVEIEMEFVEEEQTGTHLVWGRATPKLDADGCLILKKI
jgi:hypothetical protein